MDELLSIKKRSKKQHSSTSYAYFPHQQDNVMLYILRYLEVKDLLRAAQVCRKWRDLVARPFLWKTVRLKNCKITDWESMADTLQNRCTQNLDLRDVQVSNKHKFWEKFFSVVPRINNLVRLELCTCNAKVVNRVSVSFPQLKALSAMSIKYNCRSRLKLKSIGNLKQCKVLRLKVRKQRRMHELLWETLIPLEELTQLRHLSFIPPYIFFCSNIISIQTLTNLETLELGNCSCSEGLFTVLPNMKKLKRFRLEKCENDATLDILKGISKLENLSQVELANFNIVNGFDKCLAKCKYIKKLLLCISVRTSSGDYGNYCFMTQTGSTAILMAEDIAMVLEGITKLSSTLTHFVWSVVGGNSFFDIHFKFTNQQVEENVLPIFKPLTEISSLYLIKDKRNKKIDKPTDDNRAQEWRRFLQKLNFHCPISPQLLELDFLSLSQLQDLFSLALPNSKVEMLNILDPDATQYKFSDTY